MRFTLSGRKPPSIILCRTSSFKLRDFTQLGSSLLFLDCICEMIGYQEKFKSSLDPVSNACQEAFQFHKDHRSHLIKLDYLKTKTEDKQVRHHLTVV
jgi:hypothetical protein